jgi:N-acetyl-anhydromuramyl-L-alanine amidase AmpD
MSGAIKDLCQPELSISLNSLPIIRPVIENAYLALSDISRFQSSESKKHPKENFTLSEVKDVSIGMTFYVVVKTNGFKNKNNRKVKISLKQADNVIPEIPPITVTINDIPDELEKFKNSKDFKNYAIGKFTLSSQSSRELIAGQEDKHVKLYIEVDAHSPNPGFKGIEERIDYRGKKYEGSKFANAFCTENDNWIRLRAWKGIVVHSMGDEFEIDKKKVTYRQLLQNNGLSVHGFILEDGTFEGMKDLNSKAAHAGESYFQGVSDLNTCYLGYELIVGGAGTISKLKLYCDTSPSEREKEKKELQYEIENLESEKEKLSVSEKSKKSNEKKITKIEIKIKQKSSELEELDKFPYNPKQFAEAVRKTKEWMRQFGIPPEFVVRHSDVSGPEIKDNPKFDPGCNFDWSKFIDEISKPIEIIEKKFTLPTSKPI